VRATPSRSQSSSESPGQVRVCGLPSAKPAKGAKKASLALRSSKSGADVETGGWEVAIMGPHANRSSQIKHL
jgi:hypothetical protein